MPLLLAEDLRSPAKALQSQPESARPLWQSLRTWWLLLPLMYFATDGTIIVWQRSLTGAPTALSPLQIVLSLGFWFLAILQMAPAYTMILRACMRYKALTLFMGYALISSLWSSDVLDSMRKAAFLSILIFFGYFLAEKYRPEEQMRLIFGVTCLAVVGSYLMVALAPSRGLMPRGEWAGLFGHKNHLGVYLSIYLSSFFFMRGRVILLRLLGFAFVLLGIFAVYMSQSKTGWVTCAFLIAYVCFSGILMRFRSRDSLAIICAALGFVGMVAWIVFENFSSVTGLLGKDTSLTGRTVIWKNAIWAIGRHLFFGYGYAGFWGGHSSEFSAVSAQTKSVLADKYTPHAHNAVLNITLQVGIVGMAILAIALFLAFKNAYRAIVVRRSKAAYWYLGILLALLVAGSDESTFMNYLSLLTVLLVLACVGLNKLARGETP